MTRLVIAHFYPAELNIYGDSGNVTVLRKRLQWRGYDVQVVAVGVGQPFDFRDADLVFGGGGQDSDQLQVAQDLTGRAGHLRDCVDDGLPLLAVGGLYQLLGERFVTHTGREMPGVGVFRAVTTGSRVRMTGNVVIDSPFGELVGYENHSGATILASGQAPLGRVVKGYGNNTLGQFEGAMHANAVGTYLHGPVLPKNPALADHLILAALRRRQLADTLTPLDDRLELAAHHTPPSHRPLPHAASAGGAAADRRTEAPRPAKRARLLRSQVKEPHRLIGDRIAALQTKVRSGSRRRSHCRLRSRPDAKRPQAEGLVTVLSPAPFEGADPGGTVSE